MSQETFLPFTCPHCSLDFLAEVWTVINADQTPHLRQQIQQGQLNIVPCDRCNTPVFVPAPVIYFDRQERRVACFVSPLMAGTLEIQETVERLLQQLVEELPGLQLPSWAENPELVEDTNQLLGPEIPPDRDPELDLTAAMQALSTVTSEGELVQVLNQHPELMTPEAHRLLHRVVQQSREQGEHEVAAYFANLLGFLSTQVRVDSEETELLSLNESVNAKAALHALLQVTSLEEVDQTVQDYPELLSPQAVRAIRRLAHRMHQAQDWETAARLTAIADLIDDGLTALALEVIAEDES